LCDWGQRISNACGAVDQPPNINRLMILRQHDAAHRLFGDTQHPAGLNNENAVRGLLNLPRAAQLTSLPGSTCLIFITLMMNRVGICTKHGSTSTLHIFNQFKATDMQYSQHLLYVNSDRRDVLRLAIGAGAAAMLFDVGAQPAQTLKIGMVRPLTGRFASSFAPLFAPARVAAEEINAAGGILGRKIEFVEEDDEGSPAKNPAVMRKLREAGVSIVIGPVGTSQAMSALSVSNPEKMLHASGAFAVEVTDGVKYPLHYQFNYNTRQQSAALMELLKRMGPQKVGILHEVTGWGESFSGQVIDRMKAAGMTAVGVESYALTAPDVRNQIRNLQRAGTTLLVSCSSIVPGTVLVLNALNSTAWYPSIAGGNGYHSDSLLDILPKEATDKISATYLKNFSYTATKPIGDREAAYAKKLAAYPEVKGQEPNAVVSPFYDFLHVLKSVADNVKSLDPVTLKRGFDTLQNYRGISGTLSLTPEDHSALPDDAVTFVKIASARDPRAMGFFRERAFD
jgi:branched-chain amino acid transport system substrate-binding protein